ncbi:MAG: discoidin domain-containing protein, partial [Candidatus Latescibacterota bacterium]
IPRLWERGTSPAEYDTATRTFFDRSGVAHLAKHKQVALTVPASPKYHDGDESSLTNGIKGWNDYRVHWLGFEGEDMEATIDLGTVQVLASISTDFLQDIESWIFMPLSVEFSISEDGRKYRTVGEVKNTVPAEKADATVAPFAVQFERSNARFVKVKAVSMKTCPAWHKGSGEKAWIFIDEITVL